MVLPHRVKSWKPAPRSTRCTAACQRKDALGLLQMRHVEHLAIEAHRARARGKGSLLGDKTPEVIPILSKDFPTPATRPHYSILSNEKLAARFAVRLPAWETALDVAMAHLIT